MSMLRTGTACCAGLLLTAAGCGSGPGNAAPEYTEAGASAPRQAWSRRSPRTQATTSCRGSTDRSSPTGRPRSPSANAPSQGYLNDTDPAARRSTASAAARHPRLAWSWFRDNPVGFNGVPFVLFKTILDLDPEHAEPDAAPDRPHLEARGAAARRIRRRRHALDARSHRRRPQARPTTWTASRARPASADRRCPTASRFENPRTFEPLSAAETTRLRRAAAGAPRLPEHQPAARQAARPPSTRTTGNAIAPDSAAPARMDRVFFSCAACHVGRVVVDGKMKFLPGMPNTEIEAQYYSKLLMLTARGAGRVGVRPASRQRR